MARELGTQADKVVYLRWTNRALNAKRDIARSFFELAYTLKQIKDAGYYDYEYDNFKDYCSSELQIDWRTAYDYVKIADFVEQNRAVLSQDKAGLLGHKKLKLLSQKLSHLEQRQREEILRGIEERETFTQLKLRIEAKLSTAK